MTNKTKNKTQGKLRTKKGLCTLKTSINQFDSEYITDDSYYSREIHKETCIFQLGDIVRNQNAKSEIIRTLRTVFDKDEWNTPGSKHKEIYNLLSNWDVESYGLMQDICKCYDVFETKGTFKQGKRTFEYSVSAWVDRIFQNKNGDVIDTPGKYKNEQSPGYEFYEVFTPVLEIPGQPYVYQYKFRSNISGRYEIDLIHSDDENDYDLNFQVDGNLFFDYLTKEKVQHQTYLIQENVNQMKSKYEISEWQKEHIAKCEELIYQLEDNVDNLALTDFDGISDLPGAILKAIGSNAIILL